MPQEAGVKKRDRRGRKALLGLGLATTVLAGLVVYPSIAVGAEDAPAVQDHASHAVGQAELAQVRAATARFHRVEEAVAAGYELGWVNGAGNRIVAGCISSPTAGAMGYHYFHPGLMADNAVNALEPEVLVYAPAADGGLKLGAVEWVVRSAHSNPPGVPQPVRFLATLPQFAVVDGPRALRAFGRDTRYLKVRADRVSCPAGPGMQYNLADIYGGDGSQPVIWRLRHRPRGARPHRVLGPGAGGQADRRRGAPGGHPRRRDDPRARPAPRVPHVRVPRPVTPAVARLGRGTSSGPQRPPATTQAAIWDLERKPSRSRIRSTCDSADRSLIPRRPAMSLFVSPWATSCATSYWRVVTDWPGTDRSGGRPRNLRMACATACPSPM